MGLAAICKIFGKNNLTPLGMEISVYGHRFCVQRNGSLAHWVGGRYKDVAGSKNKAGYVCVDVIENGVRRVLYVHRLVAAAYLGLDLDARSIFVDHVNRTRDDNRVENLRLVTPSQNRFNTGAKGVVFTAPWSAAITVAGKTTHLGRFMTEAEAVAAYKSAKIFAHALPASVEMPTLYAVPVLNIPFE